MDLTTTNYLHNGEEDGQPGMLLTPDPDAPGVVIMQRYRDGKPLYRPTPWDMNHPGAVRELRYLISECDRTGYILTDAPDYARS